MEITMKKIILSIFAFCFLVSTASAGKNKTVSTKIGEIPDEIPCTCVFNKNRMWNPEKIVWLNEEWECAIYEDDGTCSAVQVIKIAKDKKTSIKTAEKADEDPCTCVFNKNRMWNPEKIIWNNEEWECANYKDDGTCSAVQIVKM
ncbi:MAG: hypothetical protein ACJAT7_000658 [Psychromonas sp.]|jgi:hypothetical protein